MFTELRAPILTNLIIFEKPSWKPFQKLFFLSKSKEVVLMGDYYINLIQYENRTQTLRYLDILLTNNFRNYY